MSDILYISELNPNEKNGGAAIEKRNLLYLSKNFDVDNAEAYTLGRGKLKKILDLFTSKVPTLYNRKEVKNIKNKILNSDAKVLFIETTKMGYYNKIAKKKGMKVVTFVHNNEAYLYKTTRGKLYVPFIKKQEKLAIKNSDYLIFLNERDILDYKDYYGNLSKYSILPISLDDEVNDSVLTGLKNHKKNNVGIFFGSNFPPNYNGIKWFKENVADSINAKIYVYGRGFDNCTELNSDNVIVKGEVDDVAKMMVDADFVVSPIFEGSGMKVKTCHALMYGKVFFATKESLEGYELSNGAIIQCNTKEEFISNINKFIDSDSSCFNEIARNDYLSKYSNQSFEEKITKIVNELIN